MADPADALTDVDDILADPSAVPDGVRRRKPLGVMFWMAAGFLIVLTLAAIFAEVLPLKGPADTFAGNNRAGPSPGQCEGRLRRCR